MPKINLLPHLDVSRNDTLSLRTFVKYDPMARRPATPVMVGPFVVHRKPLLGQIYTLYMIMDGDEIVRTQISYPSEGDCAAAVSARRNAKRITNAAKNKADLAKKGWQAKPIKVKEAA
ncbi:beta-hexosaminidase [Caballeronia sp. dw_276]|uniref:beta-hexosaminidase n=1 Tax=Caballeronia sp. dw_276 TaxID=2719795 RepID=UPI001BD41F5B|nr:beta-hexosaminidase [Caballeronia sp. dw_276]